jgi:outer membrane protein OmpA-like peptidoglycan-associated protein
MLKKYSMYGGICAVLLACGGVTPFVGQSNVGGAAPPPPVAVAPKVPTVAKMSRVVVTLDHIVINEKIQFELNKALIKPESNGLLDEIAKTFKENPQIKKVEIQGHASGEGDAKSNLKLSDDRAKAVLAALGTRGVKPETIVAKGYGSQKKLVEEKVEADREKNRRVDFLITDPAPPPSLAAPAASAAAPGSTPAPKSATVAAPSAVVAAPKK